MIYRLLKREMQLSLKSTREVLFISIFFVFCGVMFALGLGPAKETLSYFGANVIWVLLLLTLSLSLPNFFQKDDQDGSLEQLLTYTTPSVLFFLKAWVQTLSILVHLGMSCVFLCLIFHLDLILMGWVIIALIISLPGFIFIGGMVMCLTLKSSRSTFIRPLILFPLYTPLLLFGLGVTNSVLIQNSPLPYLKILVGVSILTQLGSTLISGRILRSCF